MLTKVKLKIQTKSGPVKYYYSGLVIVMMQLLIQNGNTIYEPVVGDGVVWSTEQKGVPGKLTLM